MKHQTYYLVTTADERTWKFDRPVLFLGEWCRLYDRKHIWQNMEAILAAPYGLGQAKKDADHIEARTLEEQLFPILCEVLNKNHGTQHNSRFWRIVLGHWLRRYVDAMLNRVRTLEQCILAYDISGTMGFDERGFTLTSIDSHAAILAFNDDRWNNELNIRILNLMGDINFPIERFTGFTETNFQRSSSPQTLSLPKKLLKLAYAITKKATRKLVRDTDGLIINSYLPKAQEIKLELALGQCPQFWTSPTLKINNTPNLLLRKQLTHEINHNSENFLQYVLHSMLFELLPVCYLEGFDTVFNMAEQHGWPKSPKFIFTSNNFDTDEAFKFWAASKIEMGSKYIVGQHGNYGVYRNHNQPSVEEITSDKFITWGWTDGMPQHTPAFIFKNVGKRQQDYNPRGGLLLIELHLNHRITTYDGSYEFASYFQDQIDFVNSIGNEPRQQLTIRLHSAFRQMRWNEEARWSDFLKDVKIDKADVHIKKLIRNSRLIVHSYDSTGILESLEANIPTLAFWQNNFDHLRESAKPYYELLLEVGIVHSSAKSIAEKINSIWDNVDDWWFGREVQEARTYFCEKYAKTSRNPIGDLKAIIAS